MHVIVKIVGYSAFAIAFGLSGALALDFHQGQNAIAVGVAILALILSAFGLLFARHSWQRGDYLSMLLGFTLWAVSAVSFTVTELGFWTSSYNERHAEYLQVKAAKARQEGLSDQAWKALTTGEMHATPAQIEAKLNAARQNERWSMSGGCISATARASQQFCEGYFNLQAEHAAAVQRAKFEKQIMADGDVKPESFTHNIFAQAESLGRWLGISEKHAADIVTITTWLLLLLARDTGLLVANPLGARREARTAAKASEATSVPLKVFPPVQPRTPLPEAPIAGLLSRKAGNSSNISSSSPEPTPPADSAPPPVEPKPEPKPIIGPVLVDENWQAPAPKGKPKKLSKSERYADIDAPTRTWLAEGHNGLMAIPVALSLGGQGPDIHDAYVAYCEARGIKPLNPSYLGRSLRRVGIASRKTSKGVTYALRLVKQPVRRAA